MAYTRRWVGQEEVDPFLPEVDPVFGDEDEGDIFLSQTEEDTKREAAIEATVIREVFGAVDLKTLFAPSVTAALSPPSGGADTRERQEVEEEKEDDEDTMEGGDVRQTRPNVAKRKRDSNFDKEQLQKGGHEAKKDDDLTIATKKRKGDGRDKGKESNA